MTLLLTELLPSRTEQNQHFISYSNAEIYVYNINSRGRYLTGSGARFLDLGFIQWDWSTQIYFTRIHMLMMSAIFFIRTVDYPRQ